MFLISIRADDQMTRCCCDLFVSLELINILEIMTWKATIALIISGIAAREQITIKEYSEDLEHRRPLVEELNCRSCFVDNENE